MSVLKLNDFYRDFGMMLKVARKKAGLTQDGLAERVGMSRSSIANIETGRQKTPLHTLLEFSGSMGVQPVDLLPAQDQPEQQTVSDKDLERRVMRIWRQMIFSANKDPHPHWEFENDGILCPKCQQIHWGAMFIQKEGIECPF